MLSDCFIIYIQMQSFIDFMYRYIIILVYQIFYAFIILRCNQSLASSLMGSQFGGSTFFIVLYSLIYGSFIHSKYLGYHFYVMCLFVCFYQYLSSWLNILITSNYILPLMSTSLFFYCIAIYRADGITDTKYRMLFF